VAAHGLVGGAIFLGCLFAGGTVEAADVIRGRELYGQQCAFCHGATGMAVMPGTPDFARGDRLMQPDLLLLNQIRAGRGTMPGFQGILPDRDILSVIAYLRTFR
jgi:cytochrome c6